MARLVPQYLAHRKIAELEPNKNLRRSGRGRLAAAAIDNELPNLHRKACASNETAEAEWRP